LSNATIGLFLSAMAIKEKCNLYIENITFIADFQAARLATTLNDNINMFSLWVDLCTPVILKCSGENNINYGILTHIGGKVKSTIFEKTIHDCAHLAPIEIKDKNAVSFIYSMHGSKIIGIGEGCVVCTNKKYVHDFIKSVRQHGRDKCGFDYKYTDNIVNGNYKLSDLQAAFANSLLDRKDELLEDRRKIAEYYCIELGLQIDYKNHYHLFMYECKSIERAKKIEKELKRKNVEFSKHFIPISRVAKIKCDDRNDYERYLRTISLPIYKGLTCAELNSIIKVIKEA